MLAPGRVRLLLTLSQRDCDFLQETLTRLGPLTVLVKGDKGSHGLLRWGLSPSVVSLSASSYSLETA